MEVVDQAGRWTAAKGEAHGLQQRREQFRAAGIDGHEAGQPFAEDASGALRNDTAKAPGKHRNITRARLQGRSATCRS